MEISIRACSVRDVDALRQIAWETYDQTFRGRFLVDERGDFALASNGGQQMRGKGYTSIDDYIGAFPPEVRGKLQQLRALIRELAPQAREKISYQMPTFFLNGNLVHFAAHSNHIGFYPTSSGVARFRRDLSPYTTSKGAIQFPLTEPLPLALIGRIVRFRVEENLRKGKR